MPRDKNSTTSNSDNIHQEHQLSLDELLSILGDYQRRALLECLWQQPDSTASVQDVAAYLLPKVEQNEDDATTHRDVQVELQHHHLPKLVDAGILEYDRRSQSIRYHKNERLETVYNRVAELTLE